MPRRYTLCRAAGVAAAAAAAAVFGVRAHGPPLPQLGRDDVTRARPAARLAQFERVVAGMHRGVSERSGSGSGAFNDESFSHNDNASAACNYWDYAPVNRFMDQFPPGWQVADVMWANDSDAVDLWNSIKGAIPNIPPKGTPSNSQQGVKYDDDAGPDCWWTVSGCTAPKLPGLPPDVAQCDEPGTWGLTYDDGPECSHNKFYDFLQEQNQTASLFYIGSNVIGYPLQAQRGLTDGHLLSAHTWSHPYMTSLTSSQVFAELYYTVKVIKYVTGVTVTSWRPPYGDVDDRVRAIAHALGLETIIWGHGEDTNDWNIAPGGAQPTASIEANYASLISQADSPALQTHGIIVLSHELNPNTEDMAMQELPKMKQAFKHVVPVQVCQNITMPYHEQNIVYPDFSDYTSGNIHPKGLPAADVIQANVAPFTAAAVTTTTVAPLPSSSASPTSATSVASGSSPGAATSAPLPGSAGAVTAASHKDGASAQKSSLAGLPAAAAIVAIGALALV